MFSHRILALAVLAGATTFAFAADETPPPAPPDPSTPTGTTEPQPAEHIDPDGGKVLRVSLPQDGSLDKAEVDFQFADGQTVTASVGKPIDAHWVLEKLAWSDDLDQMVVTIRNGNAHHEFQAGDDLVIQDGVRWKGRAAQVAIVSHFFEVPALLARRVRRDLDATPGEDRTAFEMLDRALDDGAPPQVLTPSQLETLTQFLSGCPDVDTASTPGVTTKSGQRAVIEIIREFRYPTEWQNDPLATPPLTATAFETRNTGVTLEVSPTLKAHGALVSLQLIPQVVEFLGAADIEKGTPFPNRNRARHLTERVDSPVSAPSTHGRAAHYVFSQRIERTSVDLAPGCGVLLTELREAEAEAPFLKSAPHGRLIVLVKADVVTK